MSSLSIAALFSNPDLGRRTLIDHIQAFTKPPPTRGSSFFIHLSELCPVACKHCMYSSTLSPKTLKDSLNKDDLTTAIAFISESQSAKLNITGGGEPFLKFAHILRLVAAVDVPVIEIVTAGHWAQTVGRATSVLAQLNEARRANGKLQELRLRLSLDRYHTEAPRPVTLNHYANVARAWLLSDRGVGLGYRSIEPDQGVIDTQLAELLGARIRKLDNWNHLIELDKDVAIPITFNVMRFSGNAADLDERDDLRQSTRTIQAYYEPFESAPGTLRLATAVNDAIRGEYRSDVGAAVTLNSDGSYWIFAGTSPDRRLTLGRRSFAESMEYFFADPITRFLSEDGVWRLSDIVGEIDPVTRDAALVKNDMAFLIEDLLSDPRTRLAATLLCTATLSQRGSLRIAPDSDDWAHLEPHKLLDGLRPYLQMGSGLHAGS